jgi:hypothetical protein
LSDALATLIAKQTRRLLGGWWSEFTQSTSQKHSSLRQPPS